MRRFLRIPRHTALAAVTLAQPQDDGSDTEEPQELTVHLVSVPCGRGPEHYAVISTARWAIEDGAALRELADLVDAQLAAAKAAGVWA